MSEYQSNRKSIEQKLTELSKTSNEPFPFIFRVHQRLRSQNEAAYEPEILSIGPYHRNKGNLQMMEKYKLQYFQGILERQPETSVQKYIAALKEVEEEARNYYAEHISLSQDDFVEMMLLDGCFIIEFLRKYNMDRGRWVDDPIFSMRWFVMILRRDLLLFENQLPFFVLVKLFNMTKTPGQQEDLILFAVSCLESYSGVSGYHAESNIRHLLNLMHQSWCSSFIEKEEEGHQSRSTDQKRSDLSLITCVQPFERPFRRRKQMEGIKSASELKEHGIEFKKAHQSTSWLDIKYEDGTLIIPTLMVDDNMESLLRNLVAYEVYVFNRCYSRAIVTDYISFMDCLINSSNDIKMLRHENIINNLLGNDEVVSDTFNKICNNGIVSFPEMPTYSKIVMQLNMHCSKRSIQWSRRCHRWIAELKRDYFNNPWSIIAFLAATLLVLLTLIQTIFSIHQNR